MSHNFQRGNIVAATDPSYPLHCGSSEYSHAIVIKSEPLVLVSEYADMRWETTVKPDKLKVIGEATCEQLKSADRRLEK